MTDQRSRRAALRAARHHVSSMVAAASLAVPATLLTVPAAPVAAHRALVVQLASPGSNGSGGLPLGGLLVVVIATLVPVGVLGLVWLAGRRGPVPPA